MDGYPAASLDHNIPFLVISGLLASDPSVDSDPSDQATLLKSELPPVEGQDVEALRSYFLSIDARDAPWNGRDPVRPYKFRVKVVGRTFCFPPRRETLPELETAETLKSAPVLHSPFSPLSTASPLYPDGIINDQWLIKHQDLVPSLFTCIYRLETDPNLATLRDNELKSDINQLKASLSKSGYKSRLTVVLLGEEIASPLPGSSGVQERLEGIRKGTGLDPKSIFFIVPRETTPELEKAADVILTSLCAQAVEYYRDLGRHARKKKGRGVAPQPNVPPTSGTSQTLSLQGWNARYDFKAAVFAEFRQEMDTAYRSFELAYEGLLGAELLDIIPSWSPRWNEARLLADVISIRSIRSLLWTGQATTAVRRWQSHRDRISDFVDRRGRGTNNYGWHAWEARWAMVMAGIMEKVGLPGLAPSTGVLFLQPEKVVMGERLQPWELLHHSGYWYRSAARHLADRRRLAYAIAEEDRVAPDTTISSRATMKAYQYDTYLCPEPHEEYPLDGEGVNHAQLILDCLMTARSEFQARGQHRFSAELSLECAKEMMRLEAWQDVVAVLRPLWEDMSFRAEGWLNIVEDLSWTLRAAAERAGVPDVVVSIDWELLNRKYSRRRDWHYDVSRSLENFPPKPKVHVGRSDDMMSSFVTAGFAFRSDQGKAGEMALAQLSITSHAHPNSPPVVLQKLGVEFDGSVRDIFINHEASNSPEPTKGNVVLSSVSLKGIENDKSASQDDDEEPISLSGTSDLTLQPGQTRVYEVAIPLREPGEMQAVSKRVTLDTDKFTLEYLIYSVELQAPEIWYGVGSKKRLRQNAHIITVQPRPPKMEVKLVGPRDQYYANEPIDLVIEILNAEDADAVAKLEAHLFGEQLPPFKVQVGEEERNAVAGPEESKVTGLPLGSIGSQKSITAMIRLGASDRPTAYDISIRASYHLISDPGTPIAQVKAFQLHIVNPFEANYDLMPRLHPDPWPSLFDFDALPQDLSEAEDMRVQAPSGLAQKWCLVCHYASFASEDLVILDMDADVLACMGGRCTTTRRPVLPEDGLVTPPKTMQEAQFDLIAQKLTLDDRGPASLDVAFVIKWRRANGDSSVVNTTSMLVPRYIVLGTEPRVLASLSHPGSVPSGPGLVHLDVTIENASSHFLTFGLNMEPSDEFAFSGAKQTTLHVLPLSRRSVTYRLLPLVRGAFVRPNLVVRDKYFQKVLRIIPTEGMKIDKDGLLVWIPGESDSEE